MTNCEVCNNNLSFKKLQACAVPDGTCPLNDCTIIGYHIHWICKNEYANFWKSIVDKKNKRY